MLPRNEPLLLEVRQGVAHRQWGHTEAFGEFDVRLQFTADFQFTALNLVFDRVNNALRLRAQPINHAAPCLTCVTGGCVDHLLRRQRSTQRLEGMFADAVEP